MSIICAPEWAVEIIDYDPDGPLYQGSWLDPEQHQLIRTVFEAAYSDWTETIRA